MTPVPPPPPVPLFGGGKGGGRGGVKLLCVLWPLCVYWPAAAAPSQMWMLTGEINALKKAFNAEHLAMLVRKKADNSKINEKNVRISAILAELENEEVTRGGRRAGCRGRLGAVLRLRGGWRVVLT